MKYFLAVLWDIGILYLLFYPFDKVIPLSPSWWLVPTAILFSLAMVFLGALPWEWIGASKKEKKEG